MELSDEALADLDQLIRHALREDLGEIGDCTSQSLFPTVVQGSATLLPRVAGVVCGLAVVPRVLAIAATGLTWVPLARDGQAVQPKTPLGRFVGDAREILIVERTCLNFLGRLSGIASLTAAYQHQLSGTSAELLDTRKTTPGWRRLEKYAVHCGGGTTHRMGLYDAILIKDNHLAMLKQCSETGTNVIIEAIRRARHWIANNAQRLSRGPRTVLQIEVDSLDQFEQALAADPDIILLDNMTPEMIGKAVAIRNARAPHVKLEASGGINLQTIRDVALTGVDRISVGALTHSATNFDIGLDWDLSSPS